MKVYTVKYRMAFADQERFVDVLAANKEQAYDKATYEVIPAKEGSVPYSSWVAAVTYNNGNYHTFNTCEGLAY
jgi:hypothetical protein